MYPWVNTYKCHFFEFGVNIVALRKLLTDKVIVSIHSESNGLKKLDRDSVEKVCELYRDGDFIITLGPHTTIDDFKNHLAALGCQPAINQ